VGNVWDAIKRHQTEQRAKAGRTPQPPAAPAEKTPDGEAPAAGPPDPEQPRGVAAHVRAAVEKEAERPQRPRPEKPKVEAAPSPEGYDASLVVHCERGGRISEEYRKLRETLLGHANGGKLCFMITSPRKGDGKSVTSANLALVLSEISDRRIALVDFDMRQGTLGKLLNAPASPGMSELLRGEAKLPEVIQPTAHPNLFLIPAGTIVGDEAAEITGRGDLEGIVASLRRKYDYVLLDTPPINQCSEAKTLGRQVGDALLVVKMNSRRSSRDHVQDAIGHLHAANVDVTGVVLTHRTSGGRADYPYRYSYS